MSNVNDIPRRSRLDLNTPAEKAIFEAMQEVEKAGADKRLTDAVVLLEKAKHRVGDFVDNLNLESPVLPIMIVDEEQLRKEIMRFNVWRKEQYPNATSRDLAWRWVEARKKFTKE